MWSCYDGSFEILLRGVGTFKWTLTALAYTKKTKICNFWVKFMIGTIWHNKIFVTVKTAFKNSCPHDFRYHSKVSKSLKT
jgi:hypothetical protein